MKLVKKIISIFLMMALIMPIIPQNTVKAEDYTTLATILPLDGSWSSEEWITESEPVQWYKVVLPSDGELELRIMSYACLEWEIYTQDMGETIGRGDAYDGDETSPVTKVENYDLSSGVYYIKVCGWYSTVNGRVKVRASFNSFNANDQGADSYDVPKNIYIGSSITGAITETDLEDWYKINITNDGYYQVKVICYVSLEWKMKNQDLSKEMIGSYAVNVSASNPQTVTDDVVLTKGTYYINISGYVSGYSTGRYVLSVNKLSTSNCNHNYKSSDIEASYLAKGYTLHKCEKCGKTYKDNYTAKKILSQGYIYSWGMEPGKRKIKVSYQSISDVSGYQIRYSTNKKFKKNIKVVKVGKNKTSKTLSRLKKKKRYYIQVRGYKKVKGKTVYGKWSPKRSGKTK